MKQLRKRPVKDIRNLELHPVPNRPGYYINKTGAVFSVMELCPFTDRDGYQRVHMFHKGKHKRPGVHVLLAQTFLPPPKPEQNEVRHLDGNKANLSLDNIAWGTRKENGEDKARHGSVKGEKNGRARLTVEAVKTIWVRLRNGESPTKIAGDHGVSPATIDAIKSGRNWSHVTAKMDDTPSP